MAFDDGCQDGPVLIVGSVAYDSVRTPFGEKEEVLGGAASYASVSASFFASVRLVGVVGEDFSEAHVGQLAGRDIDLALADQETPQLQASIQPQPQRRVGPPP